MADHLQVPGDPIYNNAKRARVLGHYASVRLFIFFWGGCAYFVAKLFDVTSVPAAIAIIATALAGCVAATSALRRSALRRITAFGEELREKLQARSGIDLAGAKHVGLSRGRIPFVYDGDDSWDVGFLRLENGFEYVGDRAQMRLPREDILTMKVVGYLRPRLLIRYRDGDRPKWIHLELRDGSTKTAGYTALQTLRAEIALRSTNAELPRANREEPAKHMRHFW